MAASPALFNGLRPRSPAFTLIMVVSFVAGLLRRHYFAGCDRSCKLLCGRCSNGMCIYDPATSICDPIGCERTRITCTRDQDPCKRRIRSCNRDRGPCICIGGGCDRCTPICTCKAGNCGCMAVTRACRSADRGRTASACCCLEPCCRCNCAPCTCIPAYCTYTSRPCTCMDPGRIHTDGSCKCNVPAYGPTVLLLWSVVELSLASRKYNQRPRAWKKADTGSVARDPERCRGKAYRGITDLIHVGTP